MSLLNNTEISGKKRWIYKLFVAVLLAGIPFQVFIYFWMLMGMFKTDSEIMAIPLKVFPYSFQLGKVWDDLKQYHLWSYLWNTVIYCGITILMQCTTSAMAAFALSKLRVRGARYLLLFFIGTMMMSDNVLVMPLYLTFIHLPLINVNLINNPVSIILANSAWGWALFMFKGFFDGIPNELLESSRIDGSSNAGIFSRIVLPLAKPAIAVIVLNTFMAMYNNVLFPITFLEKEGTWTIMQRVYIYSISQVAQWNTMYVILAFATIPVLIFYITCQKYIVQGISMTGLKG